MNGEHRNTDRKADLGVLRLHKEACDPKVKIKTFKLPLVFTCEKQEAQFLSQLWKRSLEIIVSQKAEKIGVSHFPVGLPHGTEAAKNSPQTPVLHQISTQEPRGVLMVKGNFYKVSFWTWENSFSLSLCLGLVSFPLRVTIRVSQEPQFSSDKNHCSCLK